MAINETIALYPPQLNDADRIARLRTRVLESKSDPARQSNQIRETAIIDARSLRTSEGIASWPVRRGLLTRDRLLSMHFELADEELFVGRWRQEQASPSRTVEAQAYLSAYQLDFDGQTGHCELDLEPLMATGLDGLSANIRGRMQQASGTDQHETYQSFLYALDGLSGMIKQAAAMIDARLQQADGTRYTELLALSEAVHHIAHNAPRTFLEALQLLWFVLIGVMQADKAWLVVPGHLDRTLWPFYASDIGAGRLTQDKALVLLEHLYIAINAYIPDGLAMGVMVGGRGAEGNDVTNELSYLCLEALRRTKMIYPAVGVCWHEGTPEDLVDLTVELMGLGYPTPAFFGDETIQRGLLARAVPQEQACRYINSTCVEITPSGASNVWVASPYYNTCGLLLDEIAAQVDLHENAATFEAFVNGYRQRLFDAVAVGVAQQNEWRKARIAQMRRPLQSVFTRDCIARGMDLEAGGAVYNWIECSFIGLANLADALYVIREEIYTHKRLSFAQLQAILRANYAGYEAVQQRFLNGYPKYGQGNADVDSLLAETIGFVVETCADFKVEPDESAYVPGAFAWIMHEHLGRETGATPDGRKAGFPFADGCGPAQGRETCGPTAAVLSVTGWDHSPMLGGLAYNLKFNASLFQSDEGYAGLKALILTYLRRGGFEVQVNVVSRETLIAARDNPDAYRDLIVRIGGYADYYTRLSPQMQEELILRMEFEQF